MITTTTDEITGREDILDSRDISERIEELTKLRDEIRFENELPDWINQDEDGYKDDDDGKIGLKWDELWDCTPEGEELEELVNFCDLFDGWREWKDGMEFIADDHFEDYARQYAEEIGAISGEERWPCSHIDWQKAAEDLQTDYTSAELFGETFWVLQS